MVPEPVEGQRGLFIVDATWGAIAPIELAPGVRTVGELDVIEQIAADRLLIDSRESHFFDAGSIPGARSVPHDTVRDVVGELDSEQPAIFFCNGPQCTATPRAIKDLLAAGLLPEAILYYRGGLHDWMTLGLPVSPGRQASA
ncbi:MAG: rhodanese-like domain-containing protein [Thermoleophilaceae bacterium]|nr:rhodanese-like domain-containing protein [Thermoleophilaceae bacterium]